MGQPPKVFGDAPLGADAQEWNGICACGKAAMDGVQCALGATHTQRMPWEIKPVPFKMPWET